MAAMTKDGISTALRCCFMEAENHISNIAHVIQLAIAPVFLISGVATLLGVLASRLGRIVDRAREIEAKLELRDDRKNTPMLEELTRLGRRARLVSLAITFGTTCALLICITIVTLFTDTFLPVQLSKLIAVLFIAAMFSLFLALIAFLREVIMATRALRISPGPRSQGGDPARASEPWVEE
jgi:MFS family permease